MQKNYKKLFSNLESLEAQEDLFGKVFFAIEKEKRKRENRIKAVLIFLFAVSIIAIPFSFIFFIRQISNSGFAYFVSAAFGNLSAFSAYWKEFLLAMAESVPVAGAAVFGINLILIAMAAYIFKVNNLKSIYHPDDR